MISLVGSRMRERRLSGSERGAVAIDEDDDDLGIAGEAGRANGVVACLRECCVYSPASSPAAVASVETPSGRGQQVAHRPYGVAKANVQRW